MNEPGSRQNVHGSRFHAKGFDYASFLFTGLTGAATFLILLILALILGNIILNGAGHFTWRFVVGVT